MIGLFSSYFGLFDEAMPAWLRQDRHEHGERLSGTLQEFDDVIYPGLIDSQESAAAAADAFATSGVDVVVVAPTMAAPPSYLVPVLESLPDAAVVVVCAQDLSAVPDDYDTEEATRRSLPVGTVMATNVLVRCNRGFRTVVGAWEDPAFQGRLAEAIRGAAAGARLRQLTVLQVGDPIEGYDDVDASPDQLASLGVRVVPVTAGHLTRAFSAGSAPELESAIVRDLDEFDASDIDPLVHRRAAQIHAALEDLCNETGASAGAVNCHSAHFRWNSEIGITACLAVSKLSSNGIPFSCTGDLPAAIGLKLGQDIAGMALYCELYQLDIPGNWLLVANGGEGDSRLREAGSKPCLVTEDHYLGSAGPGIGVSFPIAAGPMTLMSLTPTNAESGGWRMIAAEGEVLGSIHDAMEGPNGMFRFTRFGVAEGFEAWCRAGASHHAVLLPGERGVALDSAANAAGIELVLL